MSLRQLANVDLVDVDVDVKTRQISHCSRRNGPTGYLAYLDVEFGDYAINRRREHGVLFGQPGLLHLQLALGDLGIGHRQVLFADSFEQFVQAGLGLRHTSKSLGLSRLGLGNLRLRNGQLSGFGRCNGDVVVRLRCLVVDRGLLKLERLRHQSGVRLAGDLIVSRLGLIAHDAGSLHGG